MKKIISPLMIALLTLGFATFAGCDSEDDNESFDITVSWDIAGSTDCAISFNEHNVVLDTVTIKVYENRDQMLLDVAGQAGNEPLYTGNAIPCSAASHVISGLQRGTYFVKIDGFDQLEGDAAPLAYMQQERADIVVPPATDAPYNFGLNKGTSIMTVKWDMQGTCESTGIANVNVTMTDSKNQVFPAGNQPVDCKLGELTLQQLPWETYTLNVVGLDAAGLETHSTGDITYNNEIVVNPFELRPNVYTIPYWVELVAN